MNNNKTKSKDIDSFNNKSSYSFALGKEDVNVNTINGLTDQLKHTHITDDFSPNINLSRSPNSLHLNPETPPLYNNNLNKYNIGNSTSSGLTPNNNSNNNNNFTSPFVFPQSTPSPSKIYNNKPPNLFGNIDTSNNNTPNNNSNLFELFSNSTTNINNNSNSGTNYKTPDTNSTPLSTYKPTDRYKKQTPTTSQSSNYNKYRTSLNNNTYNSSGNTTTTTTTTTTTPSTSLYYNFSSKSGTSTTPTTTTTPSNTNTTTNDNKYYQKKPSIYDSPPPSINTPSINPSTLSLSNNNYSSSNSTTTTTTTNTKNNNNNSTPFNKPWLQSALNSTPVSPFSSTNVVNGNRITDTSPQPIYVPKVQTIPVPPVVADPTIARVNELLDEKLKTLAIDESDPSYDTIKEMLREEIQENIKVILDNQTAYLNNLDYYGYEEDEYDEEELTYERLVELEDVKVGVTEDQKKHIKEYKYDRIRISQNSDCQRCTICLDDFENKQLVKELLECNHYFHSACIDPWIRDHKFCPMCRKEV